MRGERLKNDGSLKAWRKGMDPLAQELTKSQNGLLFERLLEELG